MSSGKLRVVLQMSLVGAGCLVVGYGTMKAVVPTPEQTYAALAPDLRRKVDANREARLAMEEGAARGRELTNPDAERPAWAGGEGPSSVTRVRR